MINRIVKLSFRQEFTQEFIEIFNAHKIKMVAMPDCLSLELLEDIHQSNQFFTYSTWRSEEALTKYRNSEYFRTIWGKIKPHFVEKAAAWSLRVK